MKDVATPEFLSVILQTSFWSADATLIRSPGAAIASFWVLVAVLLAGCSTSDGVGSFIVDPGHYSVYHCDGLAARLKVLLAREQEIGRAKAAAS
jgi:predicted small secreted protein